VLNRNDDLHLIVTGGALSRALLRAIQQLLTHKVCTMLASTEASVIAATRVEREDDLAWHRVLPSRQVQVVDDNGQPLPPGQVGRLAVKGPTGCRYLADDRQRDYVHDGWNLTGDAYLVDDQGYFVYQARTDDMIISGGYNIAGPEVEAALLLHPAVAECGVVGVADEERGQIVKAYVVLRPGHEAGEAQVKALQDFVKQTIAPYKYPRAVAFCASLPRTETGKLQRFRLRQLAAGTATSPERI
jgi:2-aminobenzoate-CoA ligase